MSGRRYAAQLGLKENKVINQELADSKKASAKANEMQ